MSISSINLLTNKIMSDAVSRPEMIPKDQTLQDSKVLDYMSNSSKSVSGRLISFQSQKAFLALNNPNYASKYFTMHDYFPAEVKIPDGFKIDDSSDPSLKYSIDLKGRILNNPEINQVTVIDRQKDKDLQEIIQNYQSKIPKWKKEFQIIKKQYNKQNWNSYLATSTKYFVKSYSDKNLPFDKQQYYLDLLGGKETYLGKIIKSGLGVCRHEAFLFKLLLETQNIPVDCQYGYFINAAADYDSMFPGHVWNTLKKENSRVIVDVSVSDTEPSDYLDRNYNYLYANKNKSLSLKERFKQEILNMQPGQKIIIGLDENDNFITSKMKPDANFIFELFWNKKDEFELLEYSEIIKGPINKKNSEFQLQYNSKYKFKYLYNKVNKLDKDIITNIEVKDKAFELFPDDILRNFNRRFNHAYRQLEKNCNFKHTTFNISEYLKVSPDLDSKALCLFKNFIENGKKIIIR